MAGSHFPFLKTSYRTRLEKDFLGTAVLPIAQMMDRRMIAA